MHHLIEYMGNSCHNFHFLVTSNLGNLLTWRQLFRAMFCPFSVQIEWSVLRCGSADWCHRCAVWWSTYVLFNEWTSVDLNWEWEKWKLWHYISPLLIPTHNMIWGALSKTWVDNEDKVLLKALPIYSSKWYIVTKRFL